MIPFGLSSLMTVPLPIARRATKCVPVDEPIPGAAALWLFDEGQGQVLTDYSGNGNHGQLGSAAGADTNDPAWGATGLTFDGADNYVTMGTAAGLNVGNADFTLLAVVSPAIESLVTAHALIGKVTTSTNRFDLNLYANKFRALYRGSDAAITISSDANYALATPQMVTFTRAGNALNLYVGATLQAASASISTEADTAAVAFTLGASNNGGIYFYAGGYHAAAVYATALTAAQIYHNYVYLKNLLAPRGVTLA